MLSNIQKSIILKAVKIRMEAGESMEKILNSYPKLTTDERKKFMKELARFV